MEVEGVNPKIDAGRVVHGNLDGLILARTGAANGYLLRNKIDVIAIGFADDRGAQVTIGVKRIQSDAGADLGADILEVALEFKVGDFAGRKLPARNNGEGDERQQ